MIEHSCVRRAAPIGRGTSHMRRSSSCWLGPPAPRGEIVLGGFIDRLHQDTDGRWHILDFKTNDVTRGQLADVAAPYEMQLFVYALAAEQILKTSPASLTLHFLHLAMSTRSPGTPRLAGAVIDKVNEAIAL